MRFTNLHLHSTYSWDSHSSINKIVDFVSKNEQTAVALTDHGSMSGVIKFQEECRKKKIKPILGVEAYICTNQKSAKEKSPENRKLNHLVLLAKNKIGYTNLIKLVSLSNHPDNYYYKPRIDEAMLFKHSEGIIVINGHFDTSIFDCLIFNMNALSKCDSIDEGKEYLHPDYKEKILKIVKRYQVIFGDDFYIECQLFDKGDIIQQTTATVLFEFAKEFGVKAVGTGDCHYIVPEDSDAHKTFVAIKQRKKVTQLPHIGYFDSGKYGIITNADAKECYPEELILMTHEIENKIEEYEITGPQKIPTVFPTKEQSYEVVKDMVYIALKEAGLDKNKEYIERVEYELEMTKRGELQDYFLIVKDYLDWSRSKGILTGCGRGSVGGSLIAYLLKITSIDSIKYDLMWDRFMGPDRIENKVLPDIDSDFQASRRHEVIEYIKEKYGEDKVCAVVTFGLLQGKSAIKSVLSAWNVCDVKQQKDISDRIMSRDKISDKLADFRSETGSDSIILYMLTHEPKALESYVTLIDGELQGEMAMYFKLAIELEGAIKTESRHASAIIISDIPIDTVAPMMKDKKTGDLYCALDMYSFEKAQLVKFDILGLKSLDGLSVVNILLKDFKLELLRNM